MYCTPKKWIPNHTLSVDSAYWESLISLGSLELYLTVPWDSVCQPYTTPEGFSDIILNLQGINMSKRPMWRIQRMKMRYSHTTERTGEHLPLILLHRYTPHIAGRSSLFLKAWKGSLPVAAWKKVAPTLHRSTYVFINVWDAVATRLMAIITTLIICYCAQKVH